MARFDVYPLLGTDQYVVDVQSEILSDLHTRVVVPLSPRHLAQPELMRKLRPIVAVDAVEYSLNTMEMAAVPCEVLGDCVGNLEEQRAVIIDAIDFLMQGFL